MRATDVTPSELVPMLKNPRGDGQRGETVVREATVESALAERRATWMALRWIALRRSRYGLQDENQEGDEEQDADGNCSNLHQHALRLHEQPPWGIGLPKSVTS
jgi:hypothetical protein